MIRKEKYKEHLVKFKAKYGLDSSPETLAMIYHLVNDRALDVHSATDQSSACAGDHGIDGWCFDQDTGFLHIFQSKLSENSETVLAGMEDLIKKAVPWLAQVIGQGKLDSPPTDNHCLYTLFMEIPVIRPKLKRIVLRLVSLFESEELETGGRSVRVEAARDALVGSELRKVLSKLGASLEFGLIQYSLQTGTISRGHKQYAVACFEGSVVKANGASLSVGYIPLIELVSLYRSKGVHLFNKNIRLPMSHLTEKNRKRLFNPMRETLQKICKGEMESSLFSFYHGGVTVSATRCSEDSQDRLNLEQPSVVNGCQTISIADSYLTDLENKRDAAKIEIFKQVRVVSKIVVGLSEGQLKEVTNANNRQAQIDDWQLFSNDPIHIELEHSFEAIGVFYERQLGKFKSVMSETRSAAIFDNTNKTYIAVEKLGQTITLMKGDFYLAGHPGKIFADAATHNRIFSYDLPKYAKQLIFLENTKKAAINGLKKFLAEYEKYKSNDRVHRMFNNPTVKMICYYITILSLFQKSAHDELRSRFGTTLCNKASSDLSNTCYDIYKAFVSRVVTWYLEETEDSNGELTQAKCNSIVDSLCEYLRLSRTDGFPLKPETLEVRAA